MTAAGAEERFDVLPFGREHIGEAAAAELLCFSDPWSEKALAYMLPSAVTCGFACVDRQTGRLAAYGGMEYVLDEGNIINLATHPDYRRQGCARRVMDALTAFAREQGIRRLILEVRESNTAAQELYRSCGFSVAGVMPSYYRNPRENAFIMVKEDVYTGT